MSPLDIHFDTIANSVADIATPSSGNTFRWRRAFHVMTSLQNLYNVVMSISTLEATLVTYTGNLLQVTVRASPQHLDRNLLPLMLSPPHIPKPTTAKGGSR